MGAEDLRLIRNQDDLKEFAEEMRKLALEHPVDEAPEYPKDQAEYDKEFPNQIKSMEKAPPLTQMMFMAGYTFVSISLTHDVYEEQNRLHLSLCAWYASPEGNLKRRERVTDKASSAIAKAFLGDKYEEIPCKGNVLTEIRHFEAPI